MTLSNTPARATPSEEEIRAFVHEQWLRFTHPEIGGCDAIEGVFGPGFHYYCDLIVRAVIAKWGHPAPKVEASEEEIRKFVNSFYAARIHPEGRQRETVEECVSAAIARFAPPAPYDDGERRRTQDKLCDLLGCEYRDTPTDALADVIEIRVRQLEEYLAEARAKLKAPATYDAAQVEAPIEAAIALRSLRRPMTMDDLLNGAASDEWKKACRNFDFALAALRSSRPVERRVEGWAVLNHHGTACSVHMNEGDARWLVYGHPLKPMGDSCCVVPCTITLHDAAREEE